MACNLLTASLRRAVSAITATIVLPHLAFDNGLRSYTSSSFSGQAVMGSELQFSLPTSCVPNVMLPIWQGSERRLHKRAPRIPNRDSEWASSDAKHCVDRFTAEEAPLPSSYLSRTSPSGLDGEHEPIEKIPYEVAQKPPPKLKELIRISMKAKGDKNLIAFQVSKLHPSCLCRWDLTASPPHAEGQITRDAYQGSLQSIQADNFSRTKRCGAQGRESVQQKDGQQDACSQQRGCIRQEMECSSRQAHRQNRQNPQDVWRSSAQILLFIIQVSSALSTPPITHSCSLIPSSSRPERPDCIRQQSSKRFQLTVVIPFWL